MTIREAAKRYGVPVPTLQAAVTRGDIPSTEVRSGGRFGWRFDVRAIDVRRWARRTWRPRAA